MDGRFPLTGRDAERALITGLLDDAHVRGATLVIRGTPGAGKSALLEWAAATAGDRFLILRATGSAAEFGLPFAALHQIVRPVLSHSIRLPRYRRDALDVAFGRESDVPPDLFSVAMAALDLIAEAAARKPVLILADDVHRMDPSSQQALAFVGRRVASDRVVLLATYRDREEGSLADPVFAGIDLAPLDRASAAELLDRAAYALDPRTRTLILEVARGNPLALLELPRTVTAADDTVDAGRLPLTRRLERSFAARAGDLDEPTRTALNLAALSDSGDLAEIIEATELLAGPVPPAGPVTAGVLDPAVSAGLIGVEDAVVRFGHPLIRSSIYQRLSPAARRAGHDALARVLHDSPERAVWHRATAALRPDQGLAAALEQAADRALQRGATANAVRALERAAQLSAAAHDRRRRIFRAAALGYAAGRAAQADQLRSRYRALIGDDADRLRYEWLCELAGTDRDGEQRVIVLVELADQAHAAGDDDLAIQFLRSAALRCWNFCPDQPVGRSVIAAADRLAVTDAAVRAALLAYGAPLESAEDVLDIIGGVKAVDRGATTTYQLGHAAACVGAFDVAETLFTQAAVGLRAEGRLHTLGTALALLSWSALHLGHWSTAVPAAEEGARLCAETDQPFWHACALAAHATVAAHRGDFATAGDLIQVAEHVAGPHRFAAAEAVILVARAAAAAGQGEHERAFAQLARLHDPADSAHHPVHGLWSLASLAEAAALGGETDAARRILARLRPDVRATRSPAGRLNLACAGAVLAAENDTETRLRAAIRSQTATWPFERSRLLLTYGSWLRRRKRARESRDYLREARDGFDRLGARPWAERAREELRASGERSNVPVADAWDELSPQELQIASMVIQGLTNREIGERLFISHRTVGSHLYRMFPKLGISSRTELLRMAAERERA
jgi:DNA-binding CsgD family transcriptional regulator